MKARTSDTRTRWPPCKCVVMAIQASQNSVRPRRAEAVGPVVTNVAGSADKSSALSLGAFYFRPVARRAGRQHQHRTGLVGLAKSGDDFGTRTLEINIANIDSMPQFRMVMEQAVDLGTFGAIEGRPRTIYKAMLQEKEGVTFHPLQRPRRTTPSKDSVGRDRDCPRRAPELTVTRGCPSPGFVAPKRVLPESV